MNPMVYARTTRIKLILDTPGLNKETELTLIIHKTIQLFHFNLLQLWLTMRLQFDNPFEHCLSAVICINDGKLLQYAACRQTFFT